jgi:type IV fimbrial biogenesis protein FimT
LQYTKSPFARGRFNCNLNNTIHEIRNLKITGHYRNQGRLCMKKIGNSGFTMIELMATVAIAGILMTLAAPSFRTFILNNRIVTQANTLVTALNTARSEAINRGVRITVCKSSTGSACTTSGNWETGWIVFTDPADAGTYNSASEEILRVGEALEGSNTLRASTDFSNLISYLPGGFSHDDGSFRLCDERGASDMRVISISATGRIQSEKGGASCP